MCVDMVAGGILEEVTLLWPRYIIYHNFRSFGKNKGDTFSLHSVNLLLVTFGYIHSTHMEVSFSGGSSIFHFIKTRPEFLSHCFHIQYSYKYYN